MCSTRGSGISKEYDVELYTVRRKIITRIWKFDCSFVSSVSAVRYGIVLRANISICSIIS
jgi:hypothetical protein